MLEKTEGQSIMDIPETPTTPDTQDTVRIQTKHKDTTLRRELNNEQHGPQQKKPGVEPSCAQRVSISCFL
jgi:hypothetical protein